MRDKTKFRIHAAVLSILMVLAVRDDAEHGGMENLLVPVFRNGTVRGCDFAYIRSRLNANGGGEHA